MSEYYGHKRSLLAGTLLLLSFAGLYVWHFMPIYPDEIAFRLQLGRYIQDRGEVYGLYPLCTSNVKETPFLFIIPAWIMSWLDLTFSSIEIRVLPFVTDMAAVLLVVWYAVRGINLKAAVLVTTAFIGVAGSGLVLARYEYIQVLNIVFCLGAFHFLNLTSPRSSLRYGLLVVLLISSLLAIYVHIQGLLFLPLTFFLAYCLLHPHLGKRPAMIFLIMLFVLMTWTALGFQHPTCMGYPDIEQFWTKMTFNVDQFKSISIVDWLNIKLDKYLSSFLYKDIYAINYLPGIITSENWQRHLLLVLNQSIRIILLMNLMLFLYATIAAGIFATKQYFWRRQGYPNKASTELGQVQAIALVLFALPVIFLFIYDSAQNFYRSFFLNFLIAMLLAMFISRVHLTRIKSLATWYFYLCGAVVVASLFSNNWGFADRLRAGYEGPSVAINRDWNGIDHDVKALVKDCGMDISKGRIVVDDMTYDSLKSYPQLYAETYMALSAGITGLTMDDILKNVNPNFAIARCSSLRGASIEPQKIRDQLCCVNFTRAESFK